MKVDHENRTAKKPVKRKLRNRWRRHERYGALMFPRDNKGQAPQLVHFLYSEPNGFHKGALTRGNSPLNAKQRVLIRKERAKARKKLEGFMAVAA
jgi:hypothetical protein